MKTEERISLLREHLTPAYNASFLAAGIILMLGALAATMPTRGLFLVIGSAQAVTGIHSYYKRATIPWKLGTTAATFLFYLGLLVLFSARLPTWYTLLSALGLVLDVFILAAWSIHRYLPEVIAQMRKHKRLVPVLSVLLALLGVSASLSPAYAAPTPNHSSDSPSASNANSSRINE